MEHENAWIKARLLAGRTVAFSESAKMFVGMTDTDNHHHDMFVFVRLNNTSRVRLVISERPIFIIDFKDGRLSIRDSSTDETIVSNVSIEEAVVHAPEQLFLGLYEYCKIGCKFCPFGAMHSKNDRGLVHYSLDSMYEDIEKSKKKKYTSIGITTAIPYYLSSDDVADEMVFAVRKIREKIGNEIPIGISTRIPSAERLKQMHDAGANEARLNIEVSSDELAAILMPNKPKEDIFSSLRYAVDIFGAGKVSSNIIVGLGETEEETVDMVEHLAQIGVVATLYPFDPFEGDCSTRYGFTRPDAEKLYRLAVKHKAILEKSGLDTTTLLTMCPSCAASHIFPGKDL